MSCNLRSSAESIGCRSFFLYLDGLFERFDKVTTGTLARWDATTLVRLFVGCGST
ncbi:hypothetical protein [Herpetosiphon gulosus]|uniref:hypothetical protein n=1 Tax=Herpetosiphon gulosus TaxID=1973496 RepID=UPI0031E6E15D